MDDDELVQLRQEQDDTVADLAHAYPSIRALVDAGVALEPFADPHGDHQVACRLTADEIFERHRDHLEDLAARRVLDLVAFVASQITGTGPAAEAATSIATETVPDLRPPVDDDHDPAARESELRDAVALVLAANTLQATELDW